MKSGKKVVIILLVSIIILVIILVLFVISIRQISNVSLQIDQLDGGNLIYNPYIGDDLELKVGDEATVSINYSPDKNLVFTTCDYDKEIIDYHNETITAKKKGKTELSCSVIFNSKVKSIPIMIEVK